MVYVLPPSNRRRDTSSSPFLGDSMILLVSWLLLAEIQASSVYSALFDTGVTWTEFVASVGFEQGDWEGRRAAAVVDSRMVRRFENAMQGDQLLVVAEAACPDSRAVVPYVVRLAEQAHVSLRIVDRRVGRPVMDEHRTSDGRRATPTIVILHDGRAVGTWVERPIPLRDPTLRFSFVRDWHVRDGGRTTIREIVELAEESDRR